MKLRFGISPCPNDTFAFHGLLSGTSERCGLDLSLELLDIQELNERLARGDLDGGKASFAQALALADRFVVLPVGAAVGRGVGPLLVSRREDALPGPGSRVACPGAGTTAHLLLRILFPEVRAVRQVNFAQVMGRVRAGAVDYGVVIHEGRFTYHEHGLRCVADLGDLWERRTSSPLPLGGLLARRELGAGVHARLTAAVRASLEAAREDRDAAFETMRRHAQELAPAVIWKHVELYVNELTLDLGVEGRAALAAFEREARAAGLVPAGMPALEIAAP